jgi:excinuclease ABC subunit A
MPRRSASPNDTAPKISIRGARTHNLRSIDLDIFRNEITVITGVSGSGKSSLAFDTIFAEGQRQFIDTLSPYARRFFQQLPRPDVDSITGLQPTLCIDQKQTALNPRSTVGTITEVYDYLRLLMARMGIVHCYSCGQPIKQRSADSIVQWMMRQSVGTRLVVLAPMVRGRKGKHKDVIAEIQKSGLVRARINGEYYDIESTPELPLRQNHTIDAVVDRLVVRDDAVMRIAAANELALRLASGLVTVATLAPEHKDAPNSDELWSEQLFSTKYNCPTCNISYAEVEPRIFSFNSPYGACSTCDGTGLQRLAEDDEVIASTDVYQTRLPCDSCNGQRLKPESLAVKLNQLSIAQISDFDLQQLLAWISDLQCEHEQLPIAGPIIREIRSRLKFLCKVGVDYLTISRSADTLSGGELQRVRLATCIGSGLIGVCYVLDEPSIGLHPADNELLIEAIGDLQRKGNTVVIVEHDDAMMLAADRLIDMGPQAGVQGGTIVAEGSPTQVVKSKGSITADYLSGRREIALPKEYRPIAKDRVIRIQSADANNLRMVDVDIPLGLFVCVTGPSGSGKSTLINDTLQTAIRQGLHDGSDRTEWHGTISGIQQIDKLIAIDQAPIGRNARSTPATYCGLWDEVRKVFAATKDAKVRGYSAARFSFNSGDGRCENCAGQGEQKLEMNFLADVFVTCPVCNGKRFNRPTLSIRFKHKNVADVLDMSVSDAIVFFESFDRLLRLLRPLEQVGLGYVKLGQPSTTLSGGESQRVKLAFELGKPATSKTLYVLDEPTTGLHIADVAKVIDVLQSLVDRGNTVIVIEHHLDVAKVADWIIDLGPGGGKAGGHIVAIGTPITIAKNPASLTGKFLANKLKART